MERISHTISLFREHAPAWIRVALILFVLALLFSVALGGVSQNKKWHIDRIDISGTDMGTMDTMRSLVRRELEGNYFYVYSRANSYLFPSEDLEELLLETFPRMKSVTVRRVDDHTISVVVVERERYALWCGEIFHPERSAPPECWFIDREGFIFDRSPIFSRGVYVEFYGKIVEKNEGEPLQGSLPPERFAVADKFVQFLEEKIGKPFQVEFKSDKEIEVRILSCARYPFLADVAIRLMDDANPETLVNNLLKAFPVEFPDGTTKKKLRYINMNFANKVIFGFEN